MNSTYWSSAPWISGQYPGCHFPSRPMIAVTRCGIGGFDMYLSSAYASAGTSGIGIRLQLGRMDRRQAVGAGVGDPERRRLWPPAPRRTASHLAGRIVDEYDGRKDDRPGQAGHPDQDHGDHQAGGAAQAAQPVAPPGEGAGANQVEGQRTVQSTKLAAAGPG